MPESRSQTRRSDRVPFHHLKAMAVQNANDSHFTIGKRWEQVKLDEIEKQEDEMVRTNTEQTQDGPDRGCNGGCSRAFR
jgi:hypothetical protein